MGTLTGNQVRLPEHCEHKLPTSCRLSSIPNCCACADERAHAPSYSTYIDGIGFVPRGNRWQRYCWYCKEFWEKRVQVSGLRPAQTRIPEEPDQSEFLQRWYEFHRGYRIVMTADGREERVAVLGEELKDVSPGSLPRTLEEMRAGRHAEEARGRVVSQRQVQVQAENGPSLDEALDQMFADADSDMQPRATPAPRTDGRVLSSPAAEVTPTSNVHAQAMTPAATRNREQQMRRVAALRRELIRMRGGIERVVSGLRDLGERIPDQDSMDTIRRLDSFIETAAATGSQEATLNTDTLSNLASSSAAGSSSTLPNLQQRIEDARRRFTTATQVRTQAATALENADIEYRTASEEVQRLQREQRTIENYTRVFGTREEMLAQGENWESPIGGLFHRAYERFRAAEDVRREQRTLRQVLEDEERIDTDEAVSRRLEELESRERDVWGVPREPLQLASNQPQPISNSRSILGEAVPQQSGANNVDVSLILQETAAGEELVEQGPYIYEINEAMLREYFSFFENPDRGSQAPPISPQQRILDAYWARRARDRAQQDSEVPYPDQPLPSFSEQQWWHEDAEIIVRALVTDEDLREEVNLSAQEAAELLAHFTDGLISEVDLATMDGLMRNPVVVWDTSLPTQWVNRQLGFLRVKAIHSLLFSGSGEGFGGSNDWAEHYNPYIKTEVAAQAFTMSGDIRRLATTLSPPERLQMLYRLQSGLRSMGDVDVLNRLWQSDRNALVAERWCRIMVVYYRHHFGDDAAEIEHTNQNRRQQARAGDYSRAALDARRREILNRAFALTGGRQATQMRPEALIEPVGVASQERGEDDLVAGRRAALQRLHMNGFAAPNTRDRTEGRTTIYRQLTLEDSMTSSPHSSRSSSPDAGRGLDANDSGRPEAKSEKEMQVSMECKVCYTQLADIACLPCGHLVMCKWCSEQHSPCLAHDRTRPARPATCPMCRKGIKQKVRVFRA